MKSTTVLKIKETVRVRDGRRCADCGVSEDAHREAFDQKLHVHRRVPKSEYSVDGGVALCLKCHMARHGKTLHVKKIERDRTLGRTPTVFTFHVSESFRERIAIAAKTKELTAAAYLRMVATDRMVADNIPKPPPPKPKK